MYLSRKSYEEDGGRYLVQMLISGLIVLCIIHFNPFNIFSGLIAVWPR